MRGADSETESEPYDAADSDVEAPTGCVLDPLCKALPSDVSSDASAALEADLQVDISSSETLSTTNPGAHLPPPPPAQALAQATAPPAGASEFVSPFASLAAQSREPAAQRCEECSATLALLWPPEWSSPHSTDLEPAYCDCCRRVVPHGAIDARPSGADVSLCQSCHGKFVIDVDDDDASARTIDAAWIQQLSDAADAIYNDITTTVAPEICVGVKTDEADVVLSHWKQHAADLKTRQRNALRQRHMWMEHSRALYLEQVQTDHSLVQALVAAIVNGLEKITASATGVPTSVKRALFAVYKRREMPRDIAQALARPPPSLVAPVVDVEVTEHCENCSGALGPSKPTSTSEIGYCDCCRRVLPKSAIAVTSPDLRSTVCSTCHAAHLVSQDPTYYDTLGKRLDMTRIRELTAASDHLRSLLAVAIRPGISAATRAASGQRLNAAHTAVHTLQKRSQRLRLHQKKMIRDSNVSVSVSRTMYADHVAIDLALLDALRHLVSVQAEATALRPGKQSPKVVRQLRAFGVPIVADGTEPNRPPTSKKRARPSNQAPRPKAPPKKRKVVRKPRSKPKPKPKPAPKQRKERKAPVHMYFQETEMRTPPHAETKVKTEPVQLKAELVHVKNEL